MNIRSPILTTATEWSEDLTENHEEKEKVTSKSISKEDETLKRKNPKEQSTEHLEGLNND